MQHQFKIHHHDAGKVIGRARRFGTVLILESALAGLVSGAVTLAYRLGIEKAGHWREQVLSFCQGHPVRMAGWMGILLLLAWMTAWLVEREPMISGSGIPQVEGEMTGRLSQNWKRVLPAKFLGGLLCQFGGMALGREGPSIQLGAMAGKGLSQVMKRGRTEEKFLMTAGAGAGLATAFHAPLAGAMFAIEEIHKGFSVSVIVSVMTAALTSDCLCTYVMGMKPVFHFDIVRTLPFRDYWMLVILGAVLGLMGVFYNWFALKVQSGYGKLKWTATSRFVVPFLLCGLVGLLTPEMLGSGQNLIESMCSRTMPLMMLFAAWGIKFLFSSVCFGSGAPGGIFLPMLVLGGFLGGAFAELAIRLYGLDPVFLNNFVTLAMAGYFTAIVRAPLTGVILIFEMTGNATQFLSLAIVSIMAYIVATLMGSEPIYESLLDRILIQVGIRNAYQVKQEMREKVLLYVVVLHGGAIAGRTVAEVDWPEACLLVAVRRGSDEILPRGSTLLLAGDTLILMCNASQEGKVRSEIHRLNE